MGILKYILTKKFFFLVALAAMISWVFVGYDTSRGPSPERYLKKVENQLRKSSPEAAASLDRIRDQRSDRDAFIAVRSAELMGGDMEVMRMLDISQRVGDNFQAMLSEIALSNGLLPGSSQREDFFHSYGIFFQSLVGRDTPPEIFDDLSRELKQASRDPRIWPIIRDDPFGLMVGRIVDYDEGLLGYYANERDWLGGILAMIGTGDFDGMQQDNGLHGEFDNPEELIERFLTVAKEYHPHVKESVATHEFGIFGPLFFDAAGPILAYTSEQNVPLDELLEVFYLNHDRFEDWIMEFDANQRLLSLSLREAAQRHANTLVTIYRERPAVWENARINPRTLWLDSIISGEDSEFIFDRHPQDNIPFLLLVSFGEDRKAIQNGARSIRMFGDLAIYVISEYANPESRNCRLTALIKDDEVGPRIVPFLLRFESDGFDRAESNPRWIDRYFNEDGTAKDPSGLMAWPIVGAPLNVLQNWTQGYPNEWSELGWAAFDVGTLPLFFVPGGQAVSVGRTAATQGARVTTRNIIRTAARQSPSRPAPILRGGPPRSLLRVAAERTFGTGVMAVQFAGRSIRATSGFVSNNIDRVRTFYRNHPRLQTLTVRALQAGTLYIVITQRTIPHLSDAMASLGRNIGSLSGAIVEGSARAVGEMLIAAMNELTGGISIMPSLMYAGVILVFGIILFFLWPFGNLKPRSA